ncbi:MAG: HAD family hydrolase [Alphaproteobacteria bacterium]|nr:HAD family hydrolase [Alphaproteobacteria bacterium]MCB1840827.1 HAD family hydrolase [Alphaproteobacteria bacterium]
MTVKKLAVFDWNGTLIADTTMAWVASNACLEFYGKPPITLKKQRETFDFPVIHYYKRNGCDIDRVLATKEEANAIFQTRYEELAAQVRTRRGARELLEWLHGQDVSCIILSNYLTHKIEPQLRRLKIAHFFSHVSANNCDGTTILSATNKLERLSHFLVKRGYHPDHAFIIGDSMEEPDIGRKLGILSIGITGGCITEQRLRRARPDHTIHKLLEARDILCNKWGLRH